MRRGGIDERGWEWERLVVVAEAVGAAPSLISARLKLHIVVKFLKRRSLQLKMSFAGVKELQCDDCQSESRRAIKRKQINRNHGHWSSLSHQFPYDFRKLKVIRGHCSGFPV